MPVAKAFHPLGYPICAHEDCEEPPTSRGLCSKHYSRWLRDTDPVDRSQNPVTNSHLTPAHVRRIRELAAPPYPERHTYAVIGAMFGISADSVSAIVNRHTWAHVD